MNALTSRGATVLVALSVATSAATGQGAPAGDVMMRAMRDEMARSIQQLRLDTLPKPYFIAYRVTESEGAGTGANLGSILTRNEASGTRYLQVEVRVGDYAFDNTNYFGAGFMPTAFVGFASLPLDDDYLGIRRELWLSTDRAYKQAIEALSQKKAALETRSRTDSLADFTKESVTNTTDEMARPAPFNRPAMDALVKELSSAFRSVPEIYTSTARVSVGWSRTTYLNSEGTSYTRSRPSASVSATASSQALDGTNFSMSYSAQGNSFAELPAKDSLLKGVRDLIARVVDQRKTPVADVYDGPVLFEADASAELFNAMITGKLVGARRMVMSQTFAGMPGMGGNDWEDLVGSMVLPRWISVVDDPTLKTMGGRPVDNYMVDEDGVKTRRTTVIDHGVLKTLLTSRTPVTGVDHSSGSKFGGGARPVHVVVTADSTMPDKDLRAKLLAMAAAQGKPYGVIVRQLNTIASAAGDQEAMMSIVMGQQGRNQGGPVARAMRAAKVFPDGHEEPMRAADIYNLTTNSFKDITAASQSTSVHQDAFASGASFLSGGGSGLVTYQMPALLFSNITIRKPRGTTPKLPVVPPPQ